MGKLLICFNRTGKLFEKIKAMVEKVCWAVPRFYIRYLAELEDFINEQWEDAKDKKAIILS